LAPVAERSPSSSLPLYVGGFLGPFGGAVIAVLIPELQDAFGATTGEVAAAIPAYLIPFAALQLVSGTMAERLGRRRVVRTGYVAYGAFSLAAAFAPGIGAFIACRAGQGAANAFLTPILLAGLAEIVPPGRLGRSMGTFAAVQTAAIMLAPLCGGLAALIDWRIAFYAPAVVAVALAALPPPDTAREHAEPARLRAVLERRVALLAGAAFTAFVGVQGLAFLVALRAVDAFELGSTTRGLLLAGFGAAGVVAGRPAGAAVDAFGRVLVVVCASVWCAGCVAVLGLVGSAEALAGAWLLAGVGSTFMWAGLNTLVVEAVPRNRAGAISAISAFKFGGNALAPLVWLPLYHHEAALGFAAAAVAAALTAAFVLPLRRAERVAAAAA
jgi:MFS family permease